MGSISFRIIFAGIALAIIGCFLLPIIKIGSTTSVKPDWFFAMILLPFVLRLNKELDLSITRRFLTITFLIMVSSFLSEAIGGTYYLKSTASGFRLATSGLLILNKVTIFIFFIYLGFKDVISFKKLINCISIVFLLALAFGLMQFFDLGGAADIANKYYLDEGGVQSVNFAKFKRIIGTAPAIITWGGCGVLMFHYFLFIVKNKLLRIIGCSLAILNILTAASRAAIVSLIISFIAIQLVNGIIVKKNIFSTIKIILLIIFVFAGTYIAVINFIPEQVEFLVKRFGTANDAMTVSGRGAQVGYFWNLLTSDIAKMIFGVGKGVIYEYGYLEIDVFYILTAFGIVGFILHYLLIFYLLKFAFKYRQINSQMFLFIVGSTIGYLIFSVGFFFFYELYMGYPYWWLNGLVIGYIYKIYLQKEREKAKQIEQFS